MRKFVERSDLSETVLYLQEIIILPEFQKKGIGTMIVDHLVNYAKANSITGKFTTIGGVSAKGKEPFYEKMGFEIIPNGILNQVYEIINREYGGIYAIRGN